MQLYQSVRPEIEFEGRSGVHNTLPNLCITKLHALVMRLRKPKIQRHGGSGKEGLHEPIKIGYAKNVSKSVREKNMFGFVFKLTCIKWLSHFHGNKFVVKITKATSQDNVGRSSCL